MKNASQSNAAAKVREELENAIAWGEFAPGSRLDETALAARFGVSRTPIREALQQLAAAGLIEIRPRRGATVAVASPERLYEMFEVMAELEAMCARLAARRVSAEGLAALQSAQAQCARNRDDPDAYYAANEAFHQAIYRLSGNGFLASEAASLQKRLRPYRRLQLRVRNRVQTSFSEHESIIGHLEAGDGEAAAAALRDHVRVQGERFSDLVASLAQLNAA
ncbi:MAG: GntR family transcriptional regulator [Rhizobiales bacterium]|nr:GntR family transcriptional regulator [Hyphomicrobiales bacterium]